jgi:hypothetical protein
MAFFSKVKQFFGAGTIKVELSAPPQVAKTAGHLPGRIALTALSDQHVLDVTVKLVERWSTGRGEEKTEKEFELGKVTVAQAFDMKQGESRSFEFVLPFQPIKSNADQLMERGGALGMLGKAGAFAAAEKSTYKVSAIADVKGAALDPSDDKNIQLM